MHHLSPHRHILAPLAGAFIMLVTALGLAVPLLPAIAAGVITWVATVLLLAPEAPFKHLRGMKGLSTDPALLERELEEARDRAEMLRHASGAINDEDVKASLKAIVTATDAMITEVVRDPNDYPTVRKALVHYLGHAVAIARGIEVLPRGNQRLAMERKARETLPRLAQLFESYQERAFANEAFDIDTRLALLEQELSQSLPAVGERTDRADDATRPGEGRQ